MRNDPPPCAGSAHVHRLRAGDVHVHIAHWLVQWNLSSTWIQILTNLSFLTKNISREITMNVICVISVVWRISVSTGSIGKGFNLVKTGLADAYRYNCCIHESVSRGVMSCCLRNTRVMNTKSALPSKYTVYFPWAAKCLMVRDFVVLFTVHTSLF